MRTRGALVLAALLGAFVALAPPAGAQENDEEDKRQRASQHVEQGNRYKDAGEYERAAREYERAYELVPHAILFFNLGQVYRLAGERARAVDYYGRYLEADPTGQASAQARRFRGELERELKAEEAARRKRGRKDKKQKKEATAESGAATGEGTGAGDGAGTGTGADPDPPDDGKTLRIAGMATAGAGLAAVGVGIIFGLDARNKSDLLTNHNGPWTDKLLELQDKGKAAERRMFLFTGVGAAAIATGAVLYYYFGSRRSASAESELQASPVLTGDTVGFAIGGTF
jgi:tetratricopeptide (TPR) repeat protein